VLLGATVAVLIGNTVVVGGTGVAEGVFEALVGGGLCGAGAGPETGAGDVDGRTTKVGAGTGVAVGESVGALVFVGATATTIGFLLGVLVGGAVLVGVLTCDGWAGNTAGGTAIRSGSVVSTTSCSAAIAAAGFNGGSANTGASHGL
jgi:hypothetical protein